MKKILIGLLAFGSISAMAQGNCHSAVESVVENIAKVSFTDSINSVSSKMNGDASIHTKKYEVRAVLNSGVRHSYEVIVYEFETPSTNCEIDKITRL